MNDRKNEMMEKALKIVTAIRQHQGGVDNDFIPEKNITETISCPICSTGQMTYTISSYNGHRSAQCSEKCFGAYYE